MSRLVFPADNIVAEFQEIGIPQHGIIAVADNSIEYRIL